MEVDATGFGDYVELIGDCKLEIAPGIGHQLHQLGFERGEPDYFRGDARKERARRVKTRFIEGGDNLWQGVDLLQCKPLSDTLRAESEPDVQSQTVNAFCEMLHCSRKKRRAHDNERSGRQVLGVNVENARDIRKLGV